MQQKRFKKQIDAMLSFHLMKVAFQEYQKPIGKLTQKQYAKALQNAQEEMLLHRIILRSQEACCVSIPESVLHQTLRGIIKEFPSKKHFHAAIKENNLSLKKYTIALHNDLRVETILARISCNIREITADDLFCYYKNNKSEFHKPEQRSANHILIRCDSESPGTKNAAQKKILSIHRRVLAKPNTFSKEVKLFSDCSSATDNTFLSKITVGELCPKLDKTLFSLETGEISPVVENAHGFNILHCLNIFPKIHIPFSEASQSIFTIIKKKRQLNACRLWLHQLVKPQSILSQQ